MRAKLTVNNIETDLDWEELEDVVSGLKDIERNQSIFHELSKSEFEGIRMVIACMKSTSGLTVKRLARDHSIEVLRELVANDHALKFFDNESIKHMLDTNDEEIALAIADNLEEFANLMNLDALCESLIGKGPAVRASLAEQSFTPVCILIDLQEDRDISIREKAKETLKAMQFEDALKQEEKAEEKVCEFCDKGESEVEQLIAGPGVNICDECIEIMYEIVQEHKGLDK